ncbi:hypothetical protein ACQP25_38880 [Microtetraspora malaysiensis]|uniref:hypothetical protein n=1 Tax=Microtetraspora malaysiensis TaxID=161358 RepID=UPI003D9345CE
MHLDEQKIAEELHLMAREARPVDVHVYASRALARSTRRRLSWSLAGLAVATASVVGAVAVLPASGVQDTAASVQELPDNTPEQVKLVRDCMPAGRPVHAVGDRTDIPGPGKAEDFRVLVEFRDDVGSTALVGSTAGFLFCTPEKDPNFADRSVRKLPLFEYWGYAPPGGLKAGLTGALTVDDYVLEWDYARPELEGDPYLAVAGRVSPEVRRVEIDWADERRSDAQVSNGFFIGRAIQKKARFRPGGKLMNYLGGPPVTVTAYGEAGEVLGQKKNVEIRLAERTRDGSTGRPTSSPRLTP